MSRPTSTRVRRKPQYLLEAEDDDDDQQDSKKNRRKTPRTTKGSSKKSLAEKYLRPSEKTLELMQKRLRQCRKKRMLSGNYDFDCIMRSDDELDIEDPHETKNAPVLQLSSVRCFERIVCPSAENDSISEPAKNLKKLLDINPGNRFPVLRELRDIPVIKRYVPPEYNSMGKPVLPIVLGGLLVESLGTIVHDRKKFHSKRYIWPVGFISKRYYCSMTDVRRRCVYTSEILDGGEEPRFSITSAEDPANPVIASTASGAWAEVGKRVTSLRDSITGRKTNTQLSGPEMFGFSHPTIAKLLQDNPKSALLDEYVPQQFDIPRKPSGEAGLKKRKKTGKDWAFSIQTDYDDNDKYMNGDGMSAAMLDDEDDEYEEEEVLEEQGMVDDALNQGNMMDDGE
mmetsp:Transcript_50930/g.127840  ORF Transcript_50930/g.127840 Transcript_50930/m.127840 type:complete len:397 (-) Transcript_50930:86-1276(-)